MGEIILGNISFLLITIMMKWLDSADDDDDNNDSGDDADDDEHNDVSGDDADDDDEDQPASSPWSFSPSFRNLSISATACSRFSTYTRSR